MNLTDGSSCPMYQPLSMNLVALPFFTSIGSVQSAIIVCFTDGYFALHPLQSIMLVGCGITFPAVLLSVDLPASPDLQCSAFHCSDFVDCADQSPLPSPPSPPRALEDIAPV